MFCAISGEVPKEPVVSTKTGHLFEKSLIDKYLASEDKCPVTGEELTTEDLIPLKATQTAKPRPITATSIPGLLSHFQNEWDALMLETYTLKQHLDSTRKELSQVLYQHDAACRVIARLMRERDEARAMVSQRQGQMAEAAAAQAAGEAADTMDVEGGAAPTEITEAVIGELTALGKQLSKGRKKRPTPEGLASEADIGEYSEQGSATPHSSVKQGISCVDMHPADKTITLTGGLDKSAIVFNHTTNKVVAELKGHSKKLTSVKFHPDASRDVILTTSADKTAKIWSKSGKGYAESATITAHTAEVTGVSVHPTGAYAATVGMDAAWTFNSLETGACLKRVSDDKAPGGFTCVKFHPDGLILGMGTDDNMVRIWDMKTQSLVHSFEGHTKKVTALDFSENGYYMGSTSEDGTARLWDLRKLKNVKTLELGSSATSISFDHSGTYFCAAAGKDITVGVIKAWTPLATLSGHSKDATGVCFSPDATSVVSTGMDRAVKFWGK
mmetsp:Transcript_13773/g.29071  ORF Transcript_13773/g.29071 Transcript_13773/m.29071 type:complete len:500 (-) Transcript_13773:187-1686(-)